MLCLQPPENWEKTAMDDPKFAGLYQHFLVDITVLQLLKSSGFKQIYTRVLLA